jgi:hypothetical protein
MRAQAVRGISCHATRLTRPQFLQHAERHGCVLCHASLHRNELRSSLVGGRGHRTCPFVPSAVQLAQSRWPARNRCREVGAPNMPRASLRGESNSPHARSASVVSFADNAVDPVVVSRTGGRGTKVPFEIMCLADAVIQYAVHACLILGRDGWPRPIHRRQVSEHLIHAFLVRVVTPGGIQSDSQTRGSSHRSRSHPFCLATRVSYCPIVGHSFSPIGGQAFSPEWGPPVCGR